VPESARKIERYQREIEEHNMRPFWAMLYLLKRFGTKGPCEFQIIPVPAVLERRRESAQALLLV
jgi:hypothetical protein